MKTFRNLIFGLFVMMFVVVALLSSCEKDVDQPVVVPSAETLQDEVLDSTQELRSSSGSMYCGIVMREGKGFSEDTHGLPQETHYRFYVSNPSPDITRVDVVLSIPSGGTEVRPMVKNGKGNFFHEQTLRQHGRYDVKYRIFRRRSFSYQVVDPKPNYVDNTKVWCASNVLGMYWVFADGSSRSNNSVYKEVTVEKKPGDKPGNEKEWKRFKWLNGEADGRGFGGSGFGEGLHTKGTPEEYALDYNLYPYDWKPGSSMKLYPDVDRGTELYSPLDGKVVKVLDNGNSDFGKHVVIEQKLGEKTFQVCLAHLESTSVVSGQYVIGGQTVVGTLGKSGGTKAYHLHISAWDVTRSKTSIQHGMVLKPGE